ncbi:MAG: hypothetical protein K0Q74_1103 [Gammaproteobacteria bacterium]|jgi:transcriptional regulator CtsR|nr:hypothetical protein [Gammaproteobacteria bacterium]
MGKFLISVLEKFAARVRGAISDKQRSKTVVHLLEEEVLTQERALYKCAAAVEADAALHQEMQEWDVTLNDGSKEYFQT